LLAGVVPVYRGAPNASEFAPPGSFIDAEGYGGPAGLADYLRHLLATPDEYAAFFAWRSQPLPAKLAAMIEAAEPLAYQRLLAAASGASGVRGGAALPSLPFGIKAFAQARLRRMRAGRSDSGALED